MDKLCPLCNMIVSYKIKCDKCGALMSDAGRTQEFMDAYGTEEEIVFKSGCCEHYFTCENCHFNKNVNIRDIYI